MSLLLALSLLTGQTEGRRPNVLFAFADDWGRYAGIYADGRLDGPGTVNDLVRTPHFDRVARQGVVFRNAFVTAPSCTPCRTSLLSGQYFWRTGTAAILQGAVWPQDLAGFPLPMRDAGYHIGKVHKVWSPGSPRDAPFGGQRHSYAQAKPAMNRFSFQVADLVARGVPLAEAKRRHYDAAGADFQRFLDDREPDQPFLYWFGPTNPHRKWVRGSGKSQWGLDPDALKGKLPEFLPDVPAVREDFADYLGECMAFDAALGTLLERLEAAGELDDTLVVVSGDHGAPGFPRGKCNLYDFGQHVALAAMWTGAGGIPPGRVVDDFVNLVDLAPTFLEAAGVAVPEDMTGRSLMPVLTADRGGQVDPSRDHVVTGRERHVARARPGNLPYPQRAIRTAEHLLVVNFEPDRWPMGTPPAGELPDHDTLANDTFVAYADVDAGPTKAWMMLHQDQCAEAMRLGFAKRPRRELYVLADDPDQMRNVAGSSELAAVEAQLHGRLMKTLRDTGDPRVLQQTPIFEQPPFTDAK